MAMKNIRNRPSLIKDQEGTALIIMALGLTFFVAMTGLVTDVGLMYFNKIQVANAADSAALAGVQALPGDRVKAEALARDYGKKNGVEELQVNINTEGTSLEVQAQRTINLFLARVIGLTESTAAARAVAGIEPLTGVKGVVPLAIEEQPLVFGESYILKYAASDDPEGDYHSGWLGLLALQGPGAKLYLDDLKYGFDQEIKIEDILNIQTGNISGNTYDGIQYRIDQCKHTPFCTAESYDPGCTRVLLVPVIRAYDSQSVIVKGFSAFFVDSVEGMGVENYITGKFIKYIIPGSSSPMGPGYGLYVPRLYQ